MAHYHKARNQQQKKWERFKTRYGMTPAEFRALKKSDPVAAAQLKARAYKMFVTTRTV